jgi:hypothetical protein
MDGSSEKNNSEVRNCEEQNSFTEENKFQGIGSKGGSHEAERRQSGGRWEGVKRESGGSRRSQEEI